MKTFTIQINPIKAPWMEEKQTWDNRDTPECREERQQHVEKFARRVQRAFDKAWVRFSLHYKELRYEDEIIRVYAPYPTLAPSATVTVYSQRVRDYEAHRDFLRDIVSKMNIQFDCLMSTIQRQQWNLAGDSLYLLNKYLYDLQSMCRPDHHEVIFKGKNPLIANRK